MVSSFNFHFSGSVDVGLAKNKLGGYAPLRRADSHTSAPIAGDLWLNRVTPQSVVVVLCQSTLRQRTRSKRKIRQIRRIGDLVVLMNIARPAAPGRLFLPLNCVEKRKCPSYRFVVEFPSRICNRRTLGEASSLRDNANANEANSI